MRSIVSDGEGNREGMGQVPGPSADAIDHQIRKSLCRWIVKCLPETGPSVRGQFKVFAPCVGIVRVNFAQRIDEDSRFPILHNCQILPAIPVRIVNMSARSRTALFERGNLRQVRLKALNISHCGLPAFDLSLGILPKKLGVGNRLTPRQKSEIGCETSYTGCTRNRRYAKMS